MPGHALRPARAAKRIHQVDDLSRFALLLRPDLVARLLLLQQLPQRGLVMVLELLGVEVAGFRLDDVFGQLDSAPW